MRWNTLRKYSPKIVSFLFAVSFIYFFAANIVAKWDDLKIVLSDTHILLAGAGVLVFLSAAVFKAAVWSRILRTCGVMISTVLSVKFYFRSMMGKYIPGRVWPLLQRTYLCKKAGVDVSDCLKAVLLDPVVYSAARLTIVVMAIPFLLPVLGDIKRAPIYAAAAVLPLLYILLHPRVFFGLFRFISRKETGEYSQVDISYGKILVYVVIAMINLMVFGLCMYLLYISLGAKAPAISYIFIFAAVHSLALSLSGLNMVIPGDLGIREGVITFVLRYFMPLEYAIALPLLHRVASLFTDAVLISVSYAGQDE